MLPRPFTVTAPSRLHFGLLSFGRSDVRQFGGAGVMIESPGLELRVQAGDHFTATGVLAGRIEEFASRWTQFYGRQSLPPCQMTLESCGPQHSGLGVGTQLALSVAAALHAWYGEPCPPAAQLAQSVQRGLRSAIGVYGFLEGGLIVERGRLPDEPLSPLDCRVHLPDAWRVVLCCPPDMAGLSGAAEYAAFQRLPPVAPETTERLVAELRQRLLPAALQGDFSAFSDSVYQYGREAGLCYAEVQGGPYSGPLVTWLVEHLRSRGVMGVGQSSWGPTVFAFQPEERAARELALHLQTEPRLSNSFIAVSRLAAHGARIQ